MTPAQPPLPTAWYLPFHPSAAGSHTSTLMSESDEGVSVAAIRQCAGSISGGTAGAPPRPPAGTAAGGAPPRPGCTNGPAGTASALGIVTFGKVRVLMVAHGVAAQAGAAISRADSVHTRRVVMGISWIRRRFYPRR